MKYIISYINGGNDFFDDIDAIENNYDYMILTDSNQLNHTLFTTNLKELKILDYEVVNDTGINAIIKVNNGKTITVVNYSEHDFYDDLVAIKDGDGVIIYALNSSYIASITTVSK